MKLLTEAKDIQGEIDMISFVLQEQARIIPLLQDAVKDDFVLLKASDNKAELRTTFNAQVDEINGIIARLERMRRDVDEFYQSVFTPRPTSTIWKLTCVLVRAAVELEATVCWCIRSSILENASDILRETRPYNYGLHHSHSGLCKYQCGFDPRLVLINR